MSRGRKRDKTYTSTHGGDSASSKVKSLKAMERGPVSIQDRIVSPSEAEMQRAISNGQCPFCGKSFKNIAVHTNRTHGIDRYELKELAGIPKSNPVCTPEYSSALSDYAKSNPDRDRIQKMRAARTERPRSYSRAGKRVNMAKIEKMREAMPDPAELGRRNSERRRSETAERDKAIKAAYDSGLSLSEITGSFELSPGAIRRVLKFYGIADPGFRSRREIPAEQVEAMRAAGRTWSEQRTAVRLARWDSCDKSRECLREIANDWGQSTASVRNFLRSHGRGVADGRSDPGRLLKPSQKQQRIERFRELGGDFAAVRTLAKELDLRVQGLSQYLRNAGEVFEDGRTVQS